MTNLNQNKAFDSVRTLLVGRRTIKAAGIPPLAILIKVVQTRYSRAVLKSVEMQRSGRDLTRAAMRLWSGWLAVERREDKERKECRADEAEPSRVKRAACPIPRQTTELAQTVYIL